MQTASSPLKRHPWPLVIDVALGLALIAAFVANLLPLQVAGSFDEGARELARGLGLQLDDSLSVSLAQRFAVYVPLGLLAFLAIARRHRRAAFWGAALVVALVGLTVEVLQGFLSERQAFSVDFLMVLATGLLTALAGEIIANLAGRRRRAFLQTLVLGNLLALGAIWIAHQGSDLESWDCSYPLIIGNEATSDRPWLGSLRGLAIYPSALGDDDIRRLAKGFGGGAADVSRTSLGALLVETYGRDRGLEIREPATIEARHDAAALCGAIKSADAFTIEVEFASLDPKQHGPARILTMSLDPERRNVTLGQDGGRLSLRIRNELNGENGIEQQIRTRDGVVSGEWQHATARYDRGVTTLFMNGAILQPALDYESILLVSGGRSLPLAVLSGIISFLLGAAALAWIGDRIPGSAPRAAAAIMLALSPQLALDLAIAVTSQRWLSAPVTLSIIAAAITGVLSAWLVRHVTTPRRDADAARPTVKLPS